MSPKVPEPCVIEQKIETILILGIMCIPFSHQHSLFFIDSDCEDPGPEKTNALDKKFVLHLIISFPPFFFPYRTIYHDY